MDTAIAVSGRPQTQGSLCSAQLLAGRRELFFHTLCVSMWRDDCVLSLEETAHSVKNNPAQLTCLLPDLKLASLGGACIWIPVGHGVGREVFGVGSCESVLGKSRYLLWAPHL